jgi:hypothetical protein
MKRKIVACNTNLQCDSVPGILGVISGSTQIARRAGSPHERLGEPCGYANHTQYFGEFVALGLWVLFTGVVGGGCRVNVPTDGHF